MTVLPGDLDDPQVRALLEHHVTTAHSATAPGSAHALDLEDLRRPGISLWAAWEGDTLLGVGALKRLSGDHGEVKSMHTAGGHRGKGVGKAILDHLIATARDMGMTRLSLETGSWEYFAPARGFYRKHGFRDCAPFGEYGADPNSVFMTLALAPEGMGRENRRDPRTGGRMYTKEALQDMHARVHRGLAKLMDHCRGLSLEELNRAMEGFGYPTIRLQFHHLIGAEEYWTGVLNGVLHADEDDPAYPDLDSLEAYRRRVFEATERYLSGVSPAELNTRRKMLTWGSKERELVPAHVVLRTQTHIYHHQGQIIAMSRILGRPAGGMDFPID